MLCALVISLVGSEVFFILSHLRELKTTEGLTNFMQKLAHYRAGM